MKFIEQYVKLDVYMTSENLRFIKQGEIRVRIAPSPTGPLHIGTARTALFNYLFAKKHQGVFILRIEDTDLERSESRFEKDIVDNLKWLGLDWDEGLGVGGRYAPYRQSERLGTYAKYLEKLLNEKKAYHCFCSEAELEAERQYKMSQGKAPVYSGKCRDLEGETVKKYLAEGKPSIIRFKTPEKKVEFNDLIRGRIEFDASLIGDFSIAKNISTPLYNFAVVIDDFEMNVNYVIRGEDHISNTPKQILIQEALEFPRPNYAHLPLILGQDRSKMSKRHGATSLEEYKNQGYLPEAMVNFMALLGWNAGTDREIYSLASLIKEFSLERVQKGGAVFNVKKLDFLNGFYIRQRSLEKLTELCLPFLENRGLIEPGSEIGEFMIKETGEKIGIEKIQRIVALYKERLKKLSEIPYLTEFFFKKKLEYDKNLLKWKKMSEEEIKNSLQTTEKTLSGISSDDWNKDNLTKVLMTEAEKMSNRGEILWPLRVALSGKEASAGPLEIAEILGKEKTLARLKEAMIKL